MEYHNAERFGKAESLYQQILNLVPNESNVLNLLGVVAYQTGLNEDAIEWIYNSMTLSPNNEKWYYNLGAAYRAVERLLNAVECYQKALGINSNFVDAYASLRNTYSQIGRSEEVVVNFQKVLALKPGHKVVLMNISRVLYRLRSMGEALFYRRKLP